MPVSASLVSFCEFCTQRKEKNVLSLKKLFRNVHLSALVPLKRRECTSVEYGAIFVKMVEGYGYQKALWEIRRAHV